MTTTPFSVAVPAAPLATALTGGEAVPIIQGGQMKHIDVAMLVTAGPKGDTGTAGADGVDGKNIELQITPTHIQWREIGGTWANLVALSAITGPKGDTGTAGADGVDGKNIELQTTATHVQWREIGGTWANLVALTAITGPKGDTGPAGTDASLQNIADAITAERIATATLTNKTLEAPAFKGAFTEQGSSIVSSGAAQTLDLATGTFKFCNLTANCAFTFPAVGMSKQFTLLLKQDATGSRLVTWPASVKWAGGVAPTLTTTASRTDVISFVSDGTYWMGFVGGLNFAV